MCMSNPKSLLHSDTLPPRSYQPTYKATSPNCATPYERSIKFKLPWGMRTWYKKFYHFFKIFTFNCVRPWMGRPEVLNQLRILVSHWKWVWERNLGPLQEQCIILTDDTFLQLCFGFYEAGFCYVSYSWLAWNPVYKPKWPEIHGLPSCLYLPIKCVCDYIWLFFFLSGVGALSLMLTYLHPQAIT